MEDAGFYKQNTLPNLTKDSQEPQISSGKIGPYQVDTLLSKGGMSYLYLGMHPDGFPLALKVLSPKYVTHKDMVKRFLKESKIIGMTNHPNIIKLYGQGKWENGLYIAMEFVQGISLKQFIIQQNLSIKSALDIILQVSYALLHLHTHGVIHRDLKPENILITESGQVKVIDFGIAQLTQESKTVLPPHKSQFLGTPSYMSPEQKKDPLNVTFASDIYSLGVITYELILGKLSYGQINLQLMPKELRSIVKKALEPTLEERYHDVVDLITDISNYLKILSKKREPAEDVNPKELLETLEKSYNQLLPAAPPKWNAFNIGFAHFSKNPRLGTYYDFFRFANQSYAIILAESKAVEMQALTHTGLLKGMILSLIDEPLHSNEHLFDPTKFLSKLNVLLCSLSGNVHFAFHLLHLIPLENQFSFISCGFQPLTHLTNGNASPRFLSNQNPLLGTHPHQDFYETSENWEEGDTLIIHSFATNLFEKQELPNLEKTIEEALPSFRQLSAQTQAEGLSTELLKATKTTSQDSPHAVLTIERIL